MKTKHILGIILIIAVIIVAAQGSYIVEEHEQVVITQFGKPVGQAATEPGLYFKVPFIQKTNVFEKRYMEWDGDPNQVVTKDKKYIFISAYARWQISDPLQFYKRMKNETGAQTRIDDILDGETRNFIAKNDLEEVVRSENRTPLMTDSTLGIKDSLPTITIGRQKIQNDILKAAQEETSDLGIQILDFRFKRINYVQEVREQVYQRMISERNRIAAKFRSEGEGGARDINGQIEQERLIIESGAYKEAEQIKGEADARAAAIYSSAYNQSFQAKELYAFIKSMETFEKTFDGKSSVIISTDSELYKYLKDME